MYLALLSSTRLHSPADSPSLPSPLLFPLSPSLPAQEDQFASLLKEADGIADKRDACQKRIAMLRQLFDILNQLNDLAL